MQGKIIIDQSIIQGYAPGDPEVIKGRYPDGTIRFYSENTHTPRHYPQIPVIGKEIHADDVAMFDMIRELFGTIKTIVEMMDDKTYGKYGPVLESALETARSRTDEAEFVTDRRIGRIGCYVCVPGQEGFRPGRILDVTVDECPRALRMVPRNAGDHHEGDEEAKGGSV